MNGFAWLFVTVVVNIEYFNKLTLADGKGQEREWSEVVMLLNHYSSPFRVNRKVALPIDRPTDGPTDTTSHSVA